jgi:YVTN family beta-propeller protein
VGQPHGPPRAQHGPPRAQTEASGDANVRAFLIADVRGYTAFTKERGDEEAARLAGRFADVTRAVVKDHRGHVLELRGDEALVVFGSPRSAIRGAVALQRRFVEETISDPSLPLPVGIGLDAGEAVPFEGGYRGGALNVAARLCSRARAGEVLASREIVHLASHVDGVRFTERGRAELKGLDRPVHVVVVRSEDRDDAESIAPFIRSPAPPPAPWWRRKALAGLAAFAVLAALVAVPLIVRNAEGNTEIEPNSIGVLDPASNEVVGTVGLAARPGSVASSADAVWVTNPDAGTVTRIDPSGQDIRDSVQVGRNPTAIAVGEDAVWVVESGEPSVSRISADTNEVVKTIPVGNGPAGIGVGDGSVWVTSRFDGTISRIDPNRGEVVATIAVGLDPRGIAVGFGSVWVALAGSNTVGRVDPQTNELAQTIGVGNAPESLAVSADAVWVVNTLDDTVSSIDPMAGRVTSVHQVGDGPSGIAVVRDAVWVASEGDGTVSRIEPGQTSATKLMIGSVPQGLAGVNGDLWVSVRGTTTSHRGGTLRLVSIEPPDSLDTGNAYHIWPYRLLHLLGDGLVAFEPVGGASPTLVPDLATSVPSPTDGGRTYTFELRSGIRYSNGEVVAPADFRRAIERGFRLPPHDDVPILFGGLVGGDACTAEPPTCDLSRGIVTDDDAGTVTYHLVAPDPDFLSKLSMTFAYPVPASTPDEERPQEGVPGTGPYMVEAPMTRDGVALVRNPHFRVWSPEAQPGGYVDRIEWAFGVEPQDQVEAVLASDADIAYETHTSGRLEEIIVRFPAQVHASPEAHTQYISLNTEAPPFDDLEVRRAINLAVDRDRVVQILGEGSAFTTCQQLPPNFPGYEPYCPYTIDPGPEGSWTAPDMEQARRIVRRSGTAGMRVVFEYPPALWPQGEPLADYMKDLLDDLGYRGSVTSLPVGAFYGRGNDFQMGLAGWAADYPAASTFIANLHTCDTSLTPRSGFCDPQIDAMIDRAIRLQFTNPAASGRLWAAIDRAIVDQAPFVWLVNPVAVEFVSERLGNYQWHLQWGGLLNQVWVR